MAVEARHLNLFPPQLTGNREIMSSSNNIEANNVNMFNAPFGYGVPPSGTIEALLPRYCSPVTDLVPPKAAAAAAAMKSDSGLTYSTIPVSRKRSRDSINPLQTFTNGPNPNLIINNNNNNNRCGSITFLGEDISLQIQQQQLEIDRFIAQHTEKLRLEVEERRKRYSRRIIATVEQGIMNKLRSKEEEIDKIGRLNWALEEKVKSLYIENQIWRDLAQNNEATANALRSNLEQILAQLKDDNHHHHNHRGGARLDEAAAAALMDDAQSCCGSNYGGDCDVEDPRMLAESRGERKVVKDKSSDDEEEGLEGSGNNNRWCRNCWKHESCVLLLPCRHLCLCTVCGSSVNTCPICKSNKNASVHINMSS